MKFIIYTPWGYSMNIFKALPNWWRGGAGQGVSLSRTG